MATKSLKRAVALMIGAIVGAGVLGLPYVFAQAGYLIGAVTVVLLGAVILMEFLLVAELAIGTPGKHQLVGFAKHYLGDKGKIFMQIIISFAIWGAMLAYVVGSGDVFSAFFTTEAFYGIPIRIIFSLVFLFLLSIPIYCGLKTAENVELPLVAFLIVLIIAISAFASQNINLENLKTINFAKAFLPYGVILFAISGSVIIPEVKQELKGDKRLLKLAVLLGGIIPMFLYLFFTTIAVGVVGNQASEVATIALGQLTNPIVVVLGNVFAVTAMASSFIALGLVLKDTFHQDYGWSNYRAYAITIGVPLVLMFFAKSFSQILGITGAFSIGLIGILVGIMAIKSRKYKAKGFSLRHTPAPYIVIAIFLLGIILTAMQLLGLGPF